MRFRCRSSIPGDDETTEAFYEEIFEAEDLAGVFAKLDEEYAGWDERAAIPFQSPGGEMRLESVEIRSPEGDILY